MRPSIRFEIFKRDAFTCVYCGRRSPEVILEVDHVLPRSAGGGDEADNLVTSCGDCNRGKAARPLHQPAPVDFATRAEALAERERQIAEYAQWEAARRERENREIDLLGDAFARLPGAVFSRDGEQRWCWNPTSVRQFLRTLGYYGVLECIEIVEIRAGFLSAGTDSRRADAVWRYFCGTCWRRIRKSHDDTDR